VAVGVAGDNDIDLHVVTTAGCAWTAASQAGWITIRSGAGGSGDGHVHITVAPSFQVSGRSGAVVIGGTTVIVNQAGILGQDVTISGTIANLGGSCPNRQFSISGVPIVTAGSTDYPGKDDCADLRDGRSARVRGRGQADGSILATQIDHIENALSEVLGREEEQ